MKAVRYHEYGQPSVLKYEDVAEPALTDGQILIKVEAVGVNFADTRQRSNQYGFEGGALPRTPGFEAAGRIEKLQGDCGNLKVGDRVLWMAGEGGYCEKLAANAATAFAIPEGVSFEEAVALPGQALTAYFIFKDAPLEKGETVLIHAAAGGVGSVSAQIAKLLGAGTVIGTTSTKEKRDKLAKYGYDHAIDSTAKDWHKEVQKLTGDKGVNLTLDSIGDEIFHESLKCLAFGGKLVVFGRASGKDTLFDPRALTFPNQRVIGFSLYKYFQNGDAMKEALYFLFEALLKKRLSVDISTYPLKDAANVHTMLEGRATSGKLVLKP